MALPITIFGSHTCPDTGLVRDRLKALGIPFVEHDKEDDAAVEPRLEIYNPGLPTTPTIVFGDEAKVLVEPSVEEFERALAQAGYSVNSVPVVQFGGAFSDRVSPEFKLPSVRGGQFELGSLRGSRRAVLFFGHDRRCLPCRGYARQLLRLRDRIEEAEARLFVILQDHAEKSKWWSDDLGPGAEVLVDMDGAVKRRYVEYFSPALDATPEDALVFILDRYTAPRVGSAARNAGGLISPVEVAGWLQLLDSECDE